MSIPVFSCEAEGVCVVTLVVVVIVTLVVTLVVTMTLANLTTKRRILISMQHITIIVNPLYHITTHIKQVPAVMSASC